MGLREEKKEELRRRIFDTAMGLFRERGFDATRVADIVGAVRISEATFFNYFPTKEAVLQAAVADTKQLYTTLLHHYLNRPDLSVPDRVRQLVGTVGDAFVADREFMATLVASTAIFFGSTGAAKDQDIENFGLLAQIFQQGQDRGEIRGDLNAFQLAEVLTSVFMLTISNWLTGWWGDLGELRPRLDSAVDIFLDGCAAPPQPEPAAARRATSGQPSRRGAPRGS